jgi:hypothetical protein
MALSVTTDIRVSGLTGIAADVVYDGQIHMSAGEDLYLVIPSSAATGAVAMWKSTDGGVNWTEQDTADRPAATDGNALIFLSTGYHPVDDVVKVVVQTDARAGMTTETNVYAMEFDCATDQWSTTVATIATNVNFDPSILVPFLYNQAISVTPDASAGQDWVMTYWATASSMGNQYFVPHWATQASNGTWTDRGQWRTLPSANSFNSAGAAAHPENNYCMLWAEFGGNSTLYKRNAALSTGVLGTESTQTGVIRGFWPAPLVHTPNYTPPAGRTAYFWAIANYDFGSPENIHMETFWADNSTPQNPDQDVLEVNHGHAPVAAHVEQPPAVVQAATPINGVDEFISPQGELFFVWRDADTSGGGNPRLRISYGDMQVSTDPLASGNWTQDDLQDNGFIESTTVNRRVRRPSIVKDDTGTWIMLLLEHAYGGTNSPTLHEISGLNQPAGSAALTGTGSAASDGVGTMSVTRRLPGVGSAASQGVGLLTKTQSLFAVGSAASDGVGVISTGSVIPLTGVGSAASDGTAVLTKTQSLLATGSAASAGTGVLTSIQSLFATGSAASGGTGILTSSQGLTGRGGAASAGVGLLTKTQSLFATGSAASDGTGVISTSGTAALLGTGSAASAGTGTLTTTQALLGVGSASSAGVGVLTAAQTLFGVGSASSAGTGLLTSTQSMTATGSAASNGVGTMSILYCAPPDADVAPRNWESAPTASQPLWEQVTDDVDSNYIYGVPV